MENAFKGDADDIFETSYFGDRDDDIADISFSAIPSLESPKECDRERDDRSPTFGMDEEDTTTVAVALESKEEQEKARSKTWRTNYVNKMKSDMKSGRARGVKEMSANIHRDVSNNVSSRVKGGKGKKGNKTFDSGQTSLGQGRGNANVKAKIGRHGKVSVMLEHDDSDLSDIDIENDDDLNSDHDGDDSD